MNNKDEEFDKVFKALADSSRRMLLDRLRIENGQTLTQLCEGLQMSRQAVTKHLNLLQEANLVVVIWQGRDKMHYLNPVPIHQIADRWISRFDHSPLNMLSQLKDQLEQNPTTNHENIAEISIEPQSLNNEQEANKNSQRKNDTNTQKKR